jgi:CHRD domain
VKIQKYSLLFGAVLLLALNVPSRADMITFTATLLGANETTPTGSTATGFGSVVLNDATNVAVIDETWSGLSGPASASHIHAPAAAGVNGPVDIALPGAPTAPSGTLPELTVLLNASEVAWLMAGLMYMDVHTAVFPGGEIRGQLLRVNTDTGGTGGTQTVPDTGPGALGLLTLVGVAWAGTRRKRNS